MTKGNHAQQHGLAGNEWAPRIVFCERCVFGSNSERTLCRHCQGTGRAAIPLCDVLSIDHKEYIDMLNRELIGQQSSERFGKNWTELSDRVRQTRGKMK